MHLKLLTIAFLNLFLLQFNSMAQIRQNVYGGTGDDQINAIVPSPNGFMLCGSTTSSGAGNADVLVMEMDFNGNILWANTYGGVNDDIGNDITPTNDGGYAIVASSESVTPFNEQIYVLKIEADGTIDWQKFIGNDNSTEKAYAILQVSLNGYLIGGSLQSGGNETNAWVGKLRWNGQSLLWSKALGNTGAEVIHDLQQKADGTIVATGSESSFTGNGENMLLMEIDEVNGGDLLRTLSIGGANQDILYRNILTNDGGYLLYGKTLSCGTSTFNEIAVKLDAAGGLSWTKTLGTANDDNIIDVLELANDNYLFASYYRFGSSLDIQIAETDIQGEVLRAYKYGSEDGDEMVSKLESPKKMLLSGTTIVMATTTDGFDVNGKDLYLLQTDLQNIDDCNSEELNISSSDCTFNNTAINPNFNNVPLPVLQDVLIVPQPASFDQKPVCCELEATVPQSSFTICEGGSATLEVTPVNEIGLVSYTWSPIEDLDDATAENPEASPSTNRVYFVTISDETGCTATASMSVDVLPSPVVDLGESIDECEGTEVVLSANGAFANYVWQDGSMAETLAATSSGTYALTVTNADGCTATDDIAVNFEDVVNPVIDLGGDSVKICENESIVLDAGAGLGSYLWSDNSTDSQLEVSEAGTYQVVVTTNCGSGSDSIVVEVETCDDPNPEPGRQQRVLIPTAFSPNGDGINDVVSVSLNQGVELVKFVIYNRSGNTVFVSSDPTNSWNGFYENEEQNVGVYAYYLEAIDRENLDKPLLLRGNITLIR